MNRLGVVAALPAEHRALAAAVRGSHTTTSVCAGVGAAKAAAAATRLLDGGVTALLSWGCAGALQPGLDPGSLIVPEVVIAADDRRISVDRYWHERLCEKLAGVFTVHTGEIAESPSVLVEPTAKRALALHSGAVAVDMESAALGRLARARGVAFAVVRAVADSAEQALPTTIVTALDDRGRVRAAPLLLSVARPRQWRGLWAAARAYRRAQATLSRAAESGVLDTPWVCHDDAHPPSSAN